MFVVAEETNVLSSGRGLSTQTEFTTAQLHLRRVAAAIIIFLNIGSGLHTLGSHFI